MFGIRGAAAAFVFVLSAAAAHAQPATPESIIDAHGRPGGDLEIHGVAESVGPDGTTAESPFVLKISGDRSRMEIGGKVFVREGVFGQWWRGRGPRSTPRRVWEGLRDVYLTPFYALSQLTLDQRETGAGPVRFTRVFQRKTHYGHQTSAPAAELDFDPDTLLLSEARFGTVDGAQSAVTIRYSDYARLAGAAVPRRVERQVGDNPPMVFLVETVSFNARFDDDEFHVGAQP